MSMTSPAIVSRFTLRAKMVPGSFDFLRNQYIPEILDKAAYIKRTIWLPEEVVDFLDEMRVKLRPVYGGSLGNTFENDIMKLIFNATAIANIADNASSSPFTALYFSLHTGDPGEAGDQTTSEATYTSYARVSVARTSGGFTVTNNSVSPAANIDFPAGTGGSGTVTYGGIGTASSGTGKLLMSGAVSPSVVTGNGILPRLTTSSAFTID